MMTRFSQSLLSLEGENMVLTTEKFRMNFAKLSFSGPIIYYIEEVSLENADTHPSGKRVYGLLEF